MSRGRKIALIIAGALVIVAIGLSIISSARGSNSACITPRDFKDFYGRQAYESEFFPKDSFFNNSYIFLPASLDLNIDESDSIAVDAGNIARFYLTHPNTPFTLSISAIYNEKASTPKTLAEDRGKIVRDALVKAGVPNSIISSRIIDNGNIDDEDLQEGGFVTLNMASSSDCQE